MHRQHLLDCPSVPTIPALCFQEKCSRTSLACVNSSAGNVIPVIYWDTMCESGLKAQSFETSWGHSISQRPATNTHRTPRTLLAMRPAGTGTAQGVWGDVETGGRVWVVLVVWDAWRSDSSGQSERLWLLTLVRHRDSSLGPQRW